jgi:hypothetical protein
MGCPPIALAGYNDFAGPKAGHAKHFEPDTQWHSGAFGRVLSDGGVGHTRLEGLIFRTSHLALACASGEERRVVVLALAFRRSCSGAAVARVQRGWCGTNAPTGPEL